MKNLQIPKDLKAYAVKTALKRLVPCVLLLIGFVVALILWGDIILPIDKDIVKVIVYTIVMLVPFALTGVPHKMIDQTYSGIVEKVEVTTTVDNLYHDRPTRESLYLKNTVFLHVKQENGAVVRRKASEKNARISQNAEAYKAGDAVFHLYGSPQTIVLPKETDQFVQCAICGDANDKTECRCKACGHTLVTRI